MNEQQIFLTVLEKAEIASRIAALDRRFRHVDDGQAIPKKSSNPLQRIDRDALSFAQPMHQLAIVDRAAAKRRFRHPCQTAVGGDLGQKLVVFHQIGGQGWSGPNLVGRTIL